MNPTPATPSLQVRIEKYLEFSVLWITQNQERFWAIIGVIVVTVVVGGFMVKHRADFNEEAWNQLGTVQGHQMQGKTEETLKSLNEWETRFSNTSAASYAQFMKADLLMRTTDYVGAATLYATLSTTARPQSLQPLSLAAQVSAEEMAGQIPQARVTAQVFMDRYPDHFMASTVLFNQARLAERAGDTAAAALIYDRFALLYPQNPWADLLSSRQNALKAKNTSPPTIPN